MMCCRLALLVLAELATASPAWHQHRVHCVWSCWHHFTAAFLLLAGCTSRQHSGASAHTCAHCFTICGADSKANAKSNQGAYCCADSGPCCSRDPCADPKANCQTHTTAHGRPDFQAYATAYSRSDCQTHNAAHSRSYSKAHNAADSGSDFCAHDGSDSGPYNEADCSTNSCANAGTNAGTN